MTSRGFIVTVAVALPIGACTQLAGVEDGKLVTHSDAGATGPGGTKNGGSGGAGGTGAVSSGGTGGTGGDGGAAGFSAGGGGVAGSVQGGGGVSGACNQPDEATCNNVCVNLKTDAKNCNVCGHDCLGGACQNGVCQPFALATGQAYPLDLAIDASHVYWTFWGTSPTNYNDGAIRKCAITGCNDQPEVVTKSTGEPTSIAVDGTDVYFGNHSTGTIGKCPRTGCAVYTTVASGGGDPRGVALDATNVYWVSNSTGVLFQCAKTGCGSAPKSISSGIDKIFRVVIDSGYAYTGGDSVVKVQVGGFNPTYNIATNQFARGIAVNSTDVFWTNYVNGPQGGIVKCAKTSGCTQIPMVVESSGQPHDIALDTSQFYWSNEATGEIKACPLAGCPVTVTPLATGQKSPRRIVVDTQAIYWVNAGTVGTTEGSVMKLAK